MKSCFNSKMIITQNFGDDFIWSEYYPHDTLHPEWKGKYFYKDICNIKGHNGLDVVPSEHDLRIYNLFYEQEGIIIQLGFKRGYGYQVGIWYREQNICEFHNHLKFINNALELNQVINKRTYLGDMGNSGIKGMGAHNHIGICHVNDKCRRINYSNGYKGWVDPIPFL